VKDLILLALKDEAPSLFSKFNNVFEIGVGKVRSAINTMQLINQYKPNRIINFGTAGSMVLPPDLYRVNKVIQHDMNLMLLDMPPGSSLKEDHAVIYIPGNGVMCASGDLFVTEWDKLRVSCQMIDMEAYSIARAALVTDTEVEIWKYISDSANKSSTTTWEENVAAGEKKYMEMIDTLGIFV